MDLSSSVRRTSRRARRKRLGCGNGSGHGKTCCRGMDGARSRSGWSEKNRTGGQMPLFRRLPKRGFSNAKFEKRYSVVNLKDLVGFESDVLITPELLREVGLVRKLEKSGVKVLGDGFIDKAIKLRVHAVTDTAREKIEAAGGSIELIPGPKKPVRNKMKQA
jgi:large subunit ribosomal protein L15